MNNLINLLNNTYMELEATRKHLEDGGLTLDPRIEADRYRDIVAKIHTLRHEPAHNHYLAHLAGKKECVCV